MKAAINHAYGPPEILKINEIEKPALREEDAEIVIVRVHSSSINPFDIFHRKGYLPVRATTGFFKPKFNVLGIDVAGTIEAVGSNVTRFKPGDRVFGGALGSHAEYVRANQKNLAHLPDHVPCEQAAGLSTAGQTALQGLRDIGGLKAGQQVLVYGASGGIGHFAVQLGKVFGAEVTAVCSTGNQEWVKALGADHMIDYTRTDFARAGKQYDLVYDAVGKRSFFNSRPAVTADGLYISEHMLYPIYNPLQFLIGSLMGDKRAKAHLTRTNQQDLEYLGDLMAAGRLKTMVEKTYSLDQIADAHRHLENGHTKGKVIVKI